MTDWISADVLITHAVGLHARPSVKLTKLAKTFPCEVQISGTADGPWIDAKSIVKVMAMKARQNTLLYIRGQGDAAPVAVAALKDLVAHDFGEVADHVASD